MIWKVASFKIMVFITPGSGVLVLGNGSYDNKGQGGVILTDYFSGLKICSIISPYVILQIIYIFFRIKTENVYLIKQSRILNVIALALSSQILRLWIIPMNFFFKNLIHSLINNLQKYILFIYFLKKTTRDVWQYCLCINIESLGVKIIFHICDFVKSTIWINNEQNI